MCLQSLEETLQADYQHLLIMEEDFWKLNSRILCINNCDANTKFFHMSTLQRGRRNHITSLQDSVGNWISEDHIIKDHILEFYTSLYSTDFNTSGWSHSLAISCFVPPDITFSLSASLLGKEVVDAIYSFKPFKAPGPNGLHPFFYQ